MTLDFCGLDECFSSPLEHIDTAKSSPNWTYLNENIPTLINKNNLPTSNKLLQQLDQNQQLGQTHQLSQNQQEEKVHLRQPISIRKTIPLKQPVSYRDSTQFVNRFPKRFIIPKAQSNNPYYSLVEQDNEKIIPINIKNNQYFSQEQALTYHDTEASWQVILLVFMASLLLLGTQ